MSFVRNLSILAIISALSVVAQLDAGVDLLGLADVGVAVNGLNVEAVVERKRGEVLVDAAPVAIAAIDAPILPSITVPRSISVPRRNKNKKTVRRGLDTASLNAVGVNQVFSDLSTRLAPIFDSITTALESEAQRLVVNTVQSDLAQVTALLSGSLGNLNEITTTVNNIVGSVTVPTEDAVSTLVATVISDLANTLGDVNDAVSDVPALGPILSSTLSEVESTLGSIVSAVSGLLPILDDVSSLLSPVTSLLSELGLSSVVNLLTGSL